MRIRPLIISIILLASSLYAASVHGEGPEIRADLFLVGPELDKEDFSPELTDREKSYYDAMDIYLLTASPAEPVYIYFGHTGIIIDPPDEDAVMYDWGSFSFSDSFYFNFVLGLLYYSISSGWADMRIDNLVYNDRTVSLVPLDLTAESKKAVVSFISRNMQRENREYLYHYYKDNCATRVRDLYDRTTGGAFKEWASSIDTGRSYREWAGIYLSPSLFFEFILNYLEGPEIDENLTLYDACFLPEILEKTIAEFEDKERIVVYETQTRESVPESYSITLHILPISIIFAIFPLLTMTKKRWIRRAGDVLTALIELFLGVLSLILLFVMTATNHSVSYWNINILIISPIILALFVLHLASLGKKERRKGIIYTASLSFSIMVIALLLQLLTPFRQANAAYYITAMLLYASEIISARSAFRLRH